MCARGLKQKRKGGGHTLDESLELLSFRDRSFAGLYHRLADRFVTYERIFLLRNAYQTNHRFSDSLFLSQELLLPFGKQDIRVHLCCRVQGVLRRSQSPDHCVTSLKGCNTNQEQNCRIYVLTSSVKQRMSRWVQNDAETQRINDRVFGRQYQQRPSWNSSKSVFLNVLCLFSVLYLSERLHSRVSEPEQFATVWIPWSIPMTSKRQLWRGLWNQTIGISVGKGKEIRKMETKYIRIGSWDQAALRIKACISMCPVQTHSVFQNFETHEARNSTNSL